jgi:hypothetical protein
MMLMVRRDEVSALVADSSMNENLGAVHRHDGHRIRIDTDAVDMRGHTRISLAPKISCVVRWGLEASAATLIYHATIECVSGNVVHSGRQPIAATAATLVRVATAAMRTRSGTSHRERR